MNAPDEFSRYYTDLLEGTYDCVDRMVLNAYFGPGQTGGGLRSWWRLLRGDDSDLDDAHLREMAGTFSRRLHAFCAKRGIALIEAQAGERKHELAEPYLPADPKFCGLFLVVSGNAPAPLFTLSKSGNCFVEGSDFDAVNRLGWRLNRARAIGRLREVCERWIYSSCLIFALTREEQERSCFAYQYSVFQLELSRNLLFRRGATMNEVYQKLIDRTRLPLDVKQLKTIFGHSHRPHHKTTRGRKPPQLVKAVQAPSYHLTVFKVQWGNLTLKIYDKGERVLRIEVVVHNAKDLRCGKVLEKLPLLLERMRDMLVRFLNTVQLAHISFLDEGAFERWGEPTTRGTRRLAGIDLNKARNRRVLDAVVGLSTQPDGFTLAQLAHMVRARTGWTTKKYSTRSAAYDLLKLRGKKLVHRVKHSRRYCTDPRGLRTMCAYLVLREKVIKPLLAGVVRPLGRPPKNVSLLDKHYVALREQLHRTFDTIGLAA